MPHNGIEILLDNPEEQPYTPDKTIRGHVVINTEEWIHIRGIELQFMGAAYAKVYRIRRHEHDYGPLFYEQHENYFHTRALIFGNGRDLIEIPGGKSSYVFHIKFPPERYPPSIDGGDESFVRYKLAAQLFVEGEWEGNTFTNRLVNCAPIVDLNLYLAQIPNLNLPLEMTRSNSFCCWCCCFLIYGKLTVTLRLNGWGYCSNAVIPFTFDVDNGTNQDLNSIYLGLYQHCSVDVGDPLSSRSASQIFDQMVAFTELYGENAPVRRGRIVWSSELQIPGIAPTYDAPGILRNFRYDLQAIVEVSKYKRSVEMTIPVIIGNVPFALQTQVESSRHSHSHHKHKN